MDTPTTPRRDAAHDKPAEKVPDPRESRIPGLSKLPEKRPSRRSFGLRRGRREG
jgi:hypothetical protein